MAQQTSEQTDHSGHYGGVEFKPTARSEMTEGLGWMAFGVVILIGSITMDRLEAQDINPYTVPGLLPGLLGIAMIGLGFLVFIRKWSRSLNLAETTAAVPYDKRRARNRMLLVLGLCTAFCAGLLGKGLPFWLTGGTFVTVCILVLENVRKDRGEQRFSPKKIGVAAVIGYLAGVGITLVFEQIFMVRLP